MKMKILSYDVIGQDCPYGMTKENCKLRKELAELQKQRKIKYTVLENGNLVVPHFAVLGNGFDGNNFRLEDKVMQICTSCCVENRKKEQENPVEFKKQPKIQTVIFSYVQRGINICPSGECLLRKRLAELEQKYHIGYVEMNKNTLLVPKEHYNSKTNVYRDISQECAEICRECIGKNNQR